MTIRLERKTVSQNIQDARRFLEMSDYAVNYEALRKYLESYIPKAAKTYNTQVTSLRRFIRFSTASAVYYEFQNGFGRQMGFR